jgi:hypothetical protein
MKGFKKKFGWQHEGMAAFASPGLYATKQDFGQKNVLRGKGGRLCSVKQQSHNTKGEEARKEDEERWWWHIISHRGALQRTLRPIQHTITTSYLAPRLVAKHVHYGRLWKEKNGFVLCEGLDDPGFTPLIFLG